MCKDQDDSRKDTLSCKVRPQAPRNGKEAELRQAQVTGRIKVCVVHHCRLPSVSVEDEQG